MGAVGAKRHTGHPVGVADQVADLVAAGGVPHPQGLVVAAGDNAGAIGAERHTASPRRCGRSASPTGRRWPASHTRTVLVVAAGDNAGAIGAERHTAVTPSVWPVSGARTGSPVPASHTRTVLSSPPETMRVPSAAERHTASPGRCDRSVGGLLPLAASHTRTVLSTLPVTMRVPSAAERHSVHLSVVPGQRGADLSPVRRPTPAPCGRRCR